jgi:hypothetical protein
MTSNSPSRTLSLTLSSLSLAAALLPNVALAENTVDPDYTSACSFYCARTGFVIEVLDRNVNDSYKLRFWPSSRKWTLDSSGHLPGDTFVGNQDSTFANLAGGPYCTNYPTAGANYILGAVYIRYQSTSWNYAETNDLSMGGNPCTDYTINALLDVVDTYATNDSIVLPTWCEDVGCPGGGGGVDPENPGTGVWTYTDASGAEVSFDDLIGGQGTSGGGTTTGTAATGTAAPATTTTTTTTTTTSTRRTTR